ncbi:putative Ribosomal protein L11 [Candidatus Rhodobacter oscarellae]|uniref:Putative Ribosomal protein L11 n=1 Tax=Candidatus Rhodobacter oscarellae TaxID=1675527 RepID=A0A0J9E073_9RHOB|nr:MAPEG family protein [Candidatus Rhodobacter lobularis]KMW56120.1 putative Ribosomal protein L11 [Candidatus Rhodobacter lobularis]
MAKRGLIIAGMAAGLAWAVALIWIGSAYVNIPVFSFQSVVLWAFLPPGAVYALMIARMAARRMFDDALIDGQAPTGAAEIDRRVAQNTLEQLVLALLIWPGATHLIVTDGPGVLVMLGFGFAVARVLFWIGYHISPPLRAFGFAATFYPSVLILIWAVLWWIFP